MLLGHQYTSFTIFRSFMMFLNSFQSQFPPNHSFGELSTMMIPFHSPSSYIVFIFYVI